MTDDGVVRAAVRALIGMLLATVAPEYLHEDVEVTVRSASGRRLWAASIHPNQLAAGAAPGPGTDGGRPARKPLFAHSPDYRAVSWGEERFTFSPTQAGVVRQLWEAWERGEPGVGQEALLEGADSDARRLRDLFRHHLAWGRLIVPAGQGVFTLAPPD
jgi:hypothetical protein